MENNYELYKHSLDEIGYPVEYTCMTKDSHTPESYTILVVSTDRSAKWAKHFLNFLRGVWGSEMGTTKLKFI